MSKAAYWQRGESLDFVNETSATIEANTIIELSGRIGVAGTEIKPGKKGSVHVEGVFEIEKTGTSAIAMGAPVYFDGTGITDVATSNTLAGYAAQAAAADDTKILVKLQG